MLQRSEKPSLKGRLVFKAVNQSVSLLFFHRSGLSDFDFTVVKAFDDGKRFYMDALAAQLVTTMLEGFLYDESHAHQFRASLLHQVHDAFGSVPLARKSSMKSTWSPGARNPC